MATGPLLSVLRGEGPGRRMRGSARGQGKQRRRSGTTRKPFTAGPFVSTCQDYFPKLFPVPPTGATLSPLGKEAVVDWDAAIEKNREALKRVLAMLIAMAEVGGQFTFFRRKGGDSPDGAQAEKSKLSPALTSALTLPRRLHRAVLGLLRPAEAATRRLIIVAARGLAVALPPLRQRKPAVPRKAGRAGVPRDLTPRIPALPLFDRLSPWTSRVRRSARRGVPRISVPGYSEPFPVRLPSAGDPIDAARLASRLQALAAALDDLPGQAKRFARWRRGPRKPEHGHKVRFLLAGRAIAYGGRPPLRLGLRPSHFSPVRRGRGSAIRRRCIPPPRRTGERWRARRARRSGGRQRIRLICDQGYGAPEPRRYRLRRRRPAEYGRCVQAAHRAGAENPPMRCTRSWTSSTGSLSGCWKLPTRHDRGKFYTRKKINCHAEYGGVSTAGRR